MAFAITVNLVWMQVNLIMRSLCCALVTVTIARAIELKHAPGLIAALAYETANFYQKAGEFIILLLYF